jgi:photosystem II protein
MIAKIQFIKGISENTLPIVKLTRSKNGQTGTATFVFIRPEIFFLEELNKQPITGMYLLWDTKEIISKDIQIVFKDGEPFLLKIICIFKNSREWFNFLNFMNSYSKETGLFFSES